MMPLRVMMLALGLLAAVPAQAATQNPGEAATAAAAALEAASERLDAAKSANDRVKALTETVRAYEDGLQAMREGLRRVARRETQLTTQLKAREDEVADLLGVITTIV